MIASCEMRSRVNSGKYAGCNVGEFKKDLLTFYGMMDHPQREKLYSLAWSMGRQQYPGDLLGVLVAFEQLKTLLEDAV